MKKVLSALLVGAFFLSSPGMSWAQESGAAEKTSLSPQEGLQQLTSLQAMLEFFFMEAGVYPPTLEELNLAFNSELPRGSKPVPMPKDPASGKAFLYKTSPNRKAYVVSFPDPTAYGLDAGFELRSVTWGWLALRAEQRRFEEMVKLSKYHIETLATQVEMFAKDNKGAYPKTLDDLFPKYIQRHPQDPVTGRNYSYKPLADGYIVASPNPERYGLSVFQYSSSQGIQVEVLPEK